MRKGFEWSINLLIAVILLVVSVGIFWSAIIPSVGAKAPSESKPTQETTCKTDNDCLYNPYGAKCLVIYPGELFTPFCGCLTSEDCMGGDTCGSDNKCI